MPCSGFRCSDKGFFLSSDALLAVFLVIAFMSVAVWIGFERDITAPISSLHRTSRDILVELDENVFVFAVLDVNLTPDQRMDWIEQKALELLPSGTKYRIELEQFPFDPNSCVTNQQFQNCFASPIVFPARGQTVPQDKTVNSERFVFFRKGTQSFCSIGDVSSLQSTVSPFLNPIPTAFFESPKPIQLTAQFSPASDANILFSSFVNPSGTVQCDQNIRVDLNVSVLSVGRKPVDVMLVVDRSGSMSWSGVAQTNDARKPILDGNYAFLADGSGGVRTIDVNYPPIPVLRSQYNTPGTSYDVNKTGNYLFLADGPSGLRIVNAQNPLSLSSVSALSSIGTANGIAVLGNYSFLATTNSNIIDDVIVTTSSNADFRIGYNASEDWGGQSFVANNSYISGVELRLRRTGNPSDLTVHLRSSISGTDLATVVYPVSSIGTSYNWETIDFVSPVLLSSGATYYLVLTTTTQSTSNYYRWAYRNSNVYNYGQAFQQSTGQSGDLLMSTYWYEVNYDVTTTSNDNSILRIGYNSAESWAGQSFRANHAVISGIEVDLERVGNPGDLNVHLRSSISGPDLASVKYTANSVSSGSSAARTIDFNAPVSLTSGNTYFVVLDTNTQSTSNYYRWSYQTSNVYNQGQAFQQSTGQSGDLLLRTGTYGGLQVVNDSNILAPVLVGTLRTNNAQKIVIRSNTAFLVDGSSGIKAIDLSNPLLPTILSQVDTNNAQNVTLFSNYALIADGSGNLQIIDVSNPSAISKAAWFDTPGSATDIAVNANTAYIADSTGLYIVNMSNPLLPVFDRNFATAYNYRGIAVRDNWAYLAVGSSGFMTIELTTGPRIYQAKASASTFLDYNLWTDQDQLGLASFSTFSSLDHNLTINRSDVNLALYGLVASGATNIESGIDEATDELTGPNHIAQNLKFQVLLSDGQSNVGDSADAAQRAKDANIVIFTVAFGADADQAELQTIADITGGVAYATADQNALSALYQLIAEQIGEIAGAGFNQSITDSNLLVPIPSGVSILDFNGSSQLQIGNQSYLFFDIGDLNNSRKKWTGHFVLKFDCNSSFACDDQNRVLPPDGTAFEWKDANGFPQTTLLWDTNVILVLKYRDLTLRVLNADAAPNGGIWIDLNAINAGYLSTPQSQIEILLNSPLTGTVLNAVSVPAFSCGAKEPACFAFNQLYFDVLASQEGELFAVINRDRNIAECPNNNVVRVYCSATQSEFLVMKIWTWK